MPYSGTNRFFTGSVLAQHRGEHALRSNLNCLYFDKMTSGWRVEWMGGGRACFFLRNMENGNNKREEQNREADSLKWMAPHPSPLC